MAANIKGLNTLIKIQRREIDEARRALAVLEQQREALVMLSKKLNDEMEQELKLAVEYARMGNFFGNYSERIRNRQQAIAQELKVLARRILEATNAMAAKFSELKKLEIARDNRIRLDKEEQAKKESQMMDEIGIQQFARKEPYK